MADKFVVKTVNSDVPVPDVTVTDETIVKDSNDKKPAANKAVRYGIEVSSIESSPLADDAQDGKDYDHEMNLYEQEYATLPPMSNFFTKLASYTGGIEPTAGETKMLKEKQIKQKQSGKLGTLLGVYFPCIQNIFGVLLFIRLTWIVGVAGTIQALLIVSVCCVTTTLTAISMSAIATNGKVPAGGSYFMISRSLGPEFGGAVGVLFYLGTTVAAAMYIIGAVEIFLTYILDISLFGDVKNPQSLFNNTRVYGTILLFLMMCCVLVGIRFVSKFATLSLFCVLFSILSIYIGIFVSNSDRSPKVCTLGYKLLDQKDVLVDGVMRCDKNVSGPIWKMYVNSTVSDEDTRAFFESNEARLVPAIPGIGSGLILNNLWSNYARKDRLYTQPGIKGVPMLGENPMIADITSSFAILLAIFFPSVTGIMAGSNRSGDLASPERSVPLGTLLAIATTSTVYLSCVIFFSTTIDGRVARDKIGESIGKSLIVANLAWPNKWVILVGSFLSTLGAGLQSLTGAPRLLQAIAQDNVIPFMAVFKVTTKRGEPLRAQLLTLCIAQAGVLIASIDSIAPLITMFFLMCYGFVNLATALNGFLQEPSWRPRFKYHHWFLSLVGLALCIVLMFISSWIYALVAIALAGGIYKYIEFRGASNEWGDATRGLQMSAAKKAILKLSEKPIHTKNWRPQMLVLVKLDEDFKMLNKHIHLMSLCYQLRAGRGLTIVATVLKGEVNDRKKDIVQAETVLQQNISENKLKALPVVLVSSDEVEGVKFLSQCAGLGGLRHNCVAMCYPERWQQDVGKTRWKIFMAAVRSAQACGLAMIIPKGVENFPLRKMRAKAGSIDIWCIVHDGGLLLLLAHLLLRSQSWCKCSLRVFVVASEKDNTLDLKRDVTKFVYDLRIDAIIDVVELSSVDISAYNIQHTMHVRDRQQIYKEANLRTIDTKREFQAILDRHHFIDQNNTGDDNKLIHSALSLTLDTIGEGQVLSDPDTSSPGPESGDIEFKNNGGTPLEKSDSRKSGGLSPNSLTSEEQKKANEFTFSPTSSNINPLKQTFKTSCRRNHSAAHLNEKIKEKSSDAALVLVNLPGPSRTSTSAGDVNYMEYVETLTEGIKNVLLVRGSGREVVTVFAE